MTDEKCKSLIAKSGISRNPMKGIEGSFFTTNREKDIKQLIEELLIE